MLKMQRHHTLICVEREHDMITTPFHDNKSDSGPANPPDNTEFVPVRNCFFNVVTE